LVSNKPRSRAFPSAHLETRKFRQRDSSIANERRVQGRHTGGIGRGATRDAKLSLGYTATKEETTYFESTVHPVQCRLHVQRAGLLDKLGETEERLNLRWHGVQKRGCENIHSLNIAEPQLVFSSIWIAVSRVYWSSLTTHPYHDSARQTRQAVSQAYPP
jgi:hypothetical protein